MFLISLILVLFLSPISTLAQVGEGGNIYISVGDILLNFEGDLEILNNIQFTENSFYVRVAAGGQFRVISNDKYSFEVSSEEFVRKTCGLNQSSIIVAMPEDIAPLDLIVMPKKEKCRGEVLNKIIDTVRELQENPEAQQVVKKIVIPVSITVSTVAAGTLVVTASVGSASFAFNLTQLFQQLGILRFYALGFLRFRRKKPWGRVIDGLSGKPLQVALVQIYEDEFKKIKDAQITDAEGRFSAIVTPGRYFLKVSRTGFETQETSTINITSSEQILNVEIALTPKIEKFSVNYIRRINFLNKFKKFLDAINPYLLTIGTLISLGAVIIIPNLLNYTGFALYLVLDFLKIYFAFKYVKPYGRVLDASTKRAIPLAVVRAFEEKNHVLLGTKVTDEEGRFNFLLSPGTYYITCSKAGFSPFKSPAIPLRESGVASIDIELKNI
jgi:hypothetical protein